MVSEYKLIPHTTIPTQQPNGSTKMVDYYSSDEVNKSSAETWLSKLLNK